MRIEIWYLVLKNKEEISIYWKKNSLFLHCLTYISPFSSVFLSFLIDLSLNEYISRQLWSHSINLRSIWWTKQGRNKQYLFLDGEEIRIFGQNIYRWGICSSHSSEWTVDEMITKIWCLVMVWILKGYSAVRSLSGTGAEEGLLNNIQ